jgi:hydroxymethylbilane synthase
MINGQVDIAVHSMKDVPALPVGIVQAAVLERATTLDILVHKGMLISLMNQELLLLEVYDVRQWLNKYPTHKAVDLRGNVNTRMQNYKTAIGMALFCRCRIRKNQQNLKIISI